MVMLVNKVTMALEGLCMVVSRIFPIEFHKLRQLVDVLSILIVFYLLSYAIYLYLLVWGLSSV